MKIQALIALMVFGAATGLAFGQQSSDKGAAGAGKTAPAKAVTIKLGALESVVRGKSTTVVPMGLQDLLEGKTAINVHKSTDDIQTYVACGNLKSVR